MNVNMNHSYRKTGATCPREIYKIDPNAAAILIDITDRLPINLMIERSVTGDRLIYSMSVDEHYRYWYSARKFI